MIVSHEHRFIFFKTRKTAGTSIEVFLARHLGPEAIVTRVGPAVDGHAPRNFEPPPGLGARLRAMRTPEDRRDRRRGRWFFNHIPAALVRERIGAKAFDSYFKFCFERNPWDKTVSWYYFRTQNLEPKPTFTEFVESFALPSDWHIYSLNDLPVADFVGRFESLETDLQHALAQIGLSMPIELGREKATLRPVHSDPAAMFDAATSRIVRDCFRREIATFGYEPPTGVG